MKTNLMKKVIKVTIAALIAAATVVLLPGTIKKVYADDEVVVNVYRLYLPVNGEHLYTTDANEVKVLTTTYGWTHEGIGWYSPAKGTPVYRLYNEVLRNHLYTTDMNEVKVLTTKHGWKFDNNGKPMFYSGGTVGIYRLYNEGLSGLHLLTTDTNEYKVIPAYGWEQEGTKLYGVDKNNTNNSTQNDTDKNGNYEGFRTDLDMRAKELILKERTISNISGTDSNPTWNEHLYKVAQARAKEIVSNFSHDSAWAMSGYVTAEAIGIVNINTTDDASKEIVNMWKNSYGHYCVLLGGDIFSVASYETNGKIYWVCLTANEETYIAENNADFLAKEWGAVGTSIYEEKYKKYYNSFIEYHGKRNIW